MKLFFMTIVVAGVLTLPATAVAAPAPPMTVEVHPASGEVRSYFDFEARPGRSAAAGTLVLRNRTRREVTVLLDPVDGLTASTLGSAYRLRGSAMHGSTGWNELSDRRIELGPRGKAEVEVKVHPSKDAKPGDYLSGIGVQALGAGKKAKPRGNVAIASIQRYAVGVLVRLPGPRNPLIRFAGARVAREAAGVTFYLSAGNLGNVLLQNVHGSQLITKGSRVVARGPLGPGTFVTRTSIDYPILVPREQAREGSTYRVRANLHYRGRVARLDTLVRFGHSSAVRQEQLGGPDASSDDGILKFLLAGVAGLLLLLSSLAFLLWRRRRKHSDDQADETELGEPGGTAGPDDRVREKVPVG